MISPRFLPLLCVLTVVAIVPTWVHGYAGLLEIDGLTAQAIPSVLGAYRGTPTDRRANWGSRRFGSDDWIERTYTDGVRDVRLTVVRSYDPKALYHHPELAVADGMSFLRARLERMPGRTEIPAHVLRPAPGREQGAIYVLRYDQEFVSDPIAFQIRTAGELLFTRRKAMTLFFATESNVSEEMSLERTASSTVLLSAIDEFVAQSGNRAKVPETPVAP